MLARELKSSHPMRSNSESLMRLQEERRVAGALGPK